MTKKKRLRKLLEASKKSQPEQKIRNPVQLTITKGGMLIESGSGLRLMSFGGIQIVRPRVFSEATSRRKAEAYLRAKYEAGTYERSDEIGEILNYLVSYFERELVRVLARLGSKDCLHFLFTQYDAARKIEDLHKYGKLSPADAEAWSKQCSYTRRAYKFLCERIVLLRPQIDSEAQAHLSELPALYDEAIICAEELVAFSIQSDSTRYLFPEKSVFIVHPPGEDVYWELGLNDPVLTEAITRDFQERIGRDARTRNSYFTGKAFDQDWERHDAIIGEAFEKMCGMRYEKAVRALSIIPKMCKPGEMGICLIPKEKLIEGAAINMETSPESIRKVFAGFWLTADNMNLEAKRFWNSRSVYRAYRRGLFEIGHATDKHLTWSESMFIESWFMLVISMAYGIVPPEWNHPQLQTALGKLQNECGQWFEKIVGQQVIGLGLEAICSRSGFGQGSSRLESPHGEIDLIAYSEKERLLVIGESKMTMTGEEPRYFRNDLEDFVLKEKSFASKFRRKVEWILGNLPAVCRALESTREFTCPITPSSVAPIMVTFVPSIAKYMIPDFPCVALSELVFDYKKDSKWPYLKHPQAS